MRRGGYTLIELVISIAILAIIMAAVASIFMTSLKNYRTESQKSAFQRELNFTVDNIAKDVKLAAEAPGTYDTFELSSTVLILAVPAHDASKNFIYTGDVLEKDYIIYYLSGQDLKKKTYANLLGERESGETTLLSNVSATDFSYSPGMIDPGQIKVTITQSVSVGRTVTLTEERFANLRNKE